MHHDFEESRVESFLSPLGAIPPAARRRPPPVRVRRLALVAIALVAIAGVAIAATRHPGPLHRTTLTPIPSPLTCSGIIGRSADRAAAYLSAHGYKISWRFETYAGHALSQPHGSRPGMVEGYSNTVAGPPAKSLVEDVAPTNRPKSVVVFTQARGDLNAPRIVPPKCARGSSMRAP